MRVLVALLALFAAAGTAWAGSPLVSELQTFATHYHENPQKLDELKAGLEKAALADPDVETLLALSWACFLYGDLRATTVDDKLAAYDRGRQAAKQAIALAPKSGRAQFWYGANTGRWGQTKGVMRALFLLPIVKEAMETALALDPGYAPTYSLAGSIYYEVPGFVGGDLDRSEAMFRKGLEIDPHYTTMRVGLARTLLKKGRTSDARRELEAVLAFTPPSNPADWTIKDALQAKAPVAHIKERSYRPADSSKKEWAAGQCAARHQEAFLTPGRPRVAIGGIIRTLVRHAPSSRITSLAAVAAERHDPFRVLIACLLSLRTKDETTGPASARLFVLADAPAAMLRLTPKQIERAIFPVGFYRTKARVILGVCRDLIDRFGGRVPDDIDELLRA